MSQKYYFNEQSYDNNKINPKMFLVDMSVYLPPQQIEKILSC